MEAFIRTGGIKKDGLRQSGIVGADIQSRPSRGKHGLMQAHLKQIGVRQPGLRQANVPIRGIQPKTPRSVSARAQARANFSFTDLNFNKNPRYNPYT